MYSLRQNLPQLQGLITIPRRKKLVQVTHGTHGHGGPTCLETNTFYHSLFLSCLHYIGQKTPCFPTLCYNYKGPYSQKLLRHKQRSLVLIKAFPLSHKLLMGSFKLKEAFSFFMRKKKSQGITFTPPLTTVNKH